MWLRQFDQVNRTIKIARLALVSNTAWTVASDLAVLGVKLNCMF